MSELLDPQSRTEWRRAWPLPFVSAVGYGASTAHIYSAGLFIAPLEREFGWSRAAIIGGLTVISVFSVIAAPFVGLLIDRVGARRIGLPGMALYALAIAALALTGPSLLGWYALWTLLAAGSLMVKATVWTSAVASRFDRSRGLAMSITLCGAGLGSALTPILTNRLLAAFGWRGAYVALGGILAAVSIPFLLPFFRDARDLARTRPRAEVNQIPALGGMRFGVALRSARFVKLALVSFLAVSAMTALMVHMVPILVGRGFTTVHAAQIAGLAGIGSVIGRIGTGFLLDRVSGAVIGGVGFALPIVVVLALYGAGSLPLVAASAAFLLGVTLGTEVDVIGYVTSRYFGMRNFGGVFGTLIGLQSLAVGVGPLAASFVYDHSRSYDGVLLGTVPIFLLVTLLIVSMGRYPDLVAEGPVPTPEV